MRELFDLIGALLSILVLVALVVVSMFVLAVFWFGVHTPWGTLNLDIFPPRIWLMR